MSASTLGHANMNEGVETAYRLLKPRIRSTHVHDNNGKTTRTCSRCVARRRNHRLAGAPWTRCGPLDPSMPLLLELREVPDMEHPLDARSRGVRAIWRSLKSTEHES